MTDRQQYADALKARIDEWTAQIDRMEQQMQSASDEAARRYRENVDEMRRYREQASERLDEVRKSTEAEWPKLRDNIDRAWHDISEGFGKALSRFH